MKITFSEQRERCAYSGKKGNVQMERLKGYGKFTADILRLKPRFSQIRNTAVYLKRVLLKQFGSSIRGYLPISYGVFMTFKCNLKCKFCYFDWNNSSILRDDISVEEFRNIVNHPIFKGAIRITFGGGEPLLHKNLIDLINIAFEKHLYSVVYSNGLLLDKHCEELSKSRLNSINVSIYDEFLDEQTKNLSMLIKANRENKSKMVVSLTRIIATDDYEYMDKILNIAKSLGVKNIFFQNYYDSVLNTSKKAIYDDNNEYRRFLTEMKKKSKDYGLNVIFPNLLARKNTDLMCISLYSTISVDRNGNVSPCCFIVPPSSSYGNIFNDKDPWNTQFYRHLRGTFIGPPAAEYPKCKNCNLKTINSFKKVKFF